MIKRRRKKMNNTYNKIWRVQGNKGSPIHFYIAPSIDEVIKRHGVINSMEQKLTIEALGNATDGFHYVEEENEN
jgi:hypothetical protein